MFKPSARFACLFLPLLLTIGLASVPITAEALTISVVGDIMIDSPSPQVFGEVAPILQESDITIGNLEGVVSDEILTARSCGTDKKNCHRFKMPTNTVEALYQAGFDFVGIANNHAMDYGTAGLSQTQQNLDAIGLQHSGTNFDYSVTFAKGRAVSFMAVSPHSGTSNMFDSRKVCETIKEMKKSLNLASRSEKVLTLINNLGILSR